MKKLSMLVPVLLLGLTSGAGAKNIFTEAVCHHIKKENAKEACEMIVDHGTDIYKNCNGEHGQDLIKNYFCNPQAGMPHIPSCTDADQHHLHSIRDAMMGHDQSLVLVCSL